MIKTKDIGELLMRLIDFINVQPVLNLMVVKEA
jgi:hypothetical protein